eukprot:scaffold133924_cov22-Tisochrysis_lutea.AAC.1
MSLSASGDQSRTETGCGACCSASSRARRSASDQSITMPSSHPIASREPSWICGGDHASSRGLAPGSLGRMTTSSYGCPSESMSMTVPPSVRPARTDVSVCDDPCVGLVQTARRGREGE